MKVLKCLKCGTDLVYITEDTFLLSKRLLNPNIKTLKKLSDKKWLGHYSICPRCDAYALGAELVSGLPILLQDGSVSSFNEIEDNLW